jgi:hypothetical protein
MRVAAGYCTLVIDGNRLEKLSCAIEIMGGSDLPPYGFLSGPVDALKRAATASQVRIEIEDGPILHARVLQVNPTGLALISVEACKA